MDEKSLSKEWLDLAQMDLASAEYLLGMRPLPIEIICYHCEQAAEKLLKGILVYCGVDAPKTHDLVQLCKLCTQIDPYWAELSEACIELTPYGVQIRYPTNLELNEYDMDCALRECRRMDEFVRKRLELYETTEQKPFSASPQMSM